MGTIAKFCVCVFLGGGTPIESRWEQSPSWVVLEVQIKLHLKDLDLGCPGRAI